MLNHILAGQTSGIYPAAQEHSHGLVFALGLLAAMTGVGIALGGQAAMFLMLAVVACVFVFMDFRIGVVLLIVFLPISNSAVFPRQLLGVTGLNPLNVLLLGTLASYWLRSRTGESFRGFVPRPLLWLYIVPILVAGAIGVRHVGEIAPELIATATVEITNASSYVRDLVVKPLCMVLFALLTGVAVSRSRDPEKFLVPMLASVVVMSLMVVVFVYLSGLSLADLSSSTARTAFSPLGIHANDLGRLYAVAYGLMLFSFARTQRLELKPLLLIGMGAVVVALVLTFSRGAFVGFLLINVLFLFSRRNVFAFILFSACMVAALIFMPGAVYDRVLMGFDGNLNELTAGRTEEIWEPLMPEMFKSPVWGSGLMSITWSNAMASGAMLPVGHPHNAYLQAFMDMGVVGLVLVLAYFAGIWKGFRRLGRDASLSPGMQGFFQGAAAGLLSLLVAGMAGSSLLPVPEQAFLWLAIGVMYGILRKKQAAEAPAQPDAGSAMRDAAGRMHR